MNKKIFTMLRLAMGVVIILVLLYKISMTEIISTFMSIKPIFILLVPLFVVLPLLIGAFNIKLLLIPIKDVAYISLFKMYSFCWAIGMVLPGKLGEFSIAYFLKEKEGIPLGQGAVIFILDNLITLFNLVILAVIGALFFLNSFDVIRILASISVIIIGVLLFIFWPPLRNFFKKYVLRQYASKFKGFYQTLSFFLTKRKLLLLINSCVTWLKFLCGIAIVYIIFASFNVYVPLLVIILIAAISRIISLVPITISGLGVREAVNVSLYSLYGVSSAVVLTMCLIMLFINYSFAALISFTAKI